MKHSDIELKPCVCGNTMVGIAHKPTPFGNVYFGECGVCEIESPAREEIEDAAKAWNNFIDFLNILQGDDEDE